MAEGLQTEKPRSGEEQRFMVLSPLRRNNLATSRGEAAVLIQRLMSR